MHHAQRGVTLGAGAGRTLVAGVRLGPDDLILDLRLVEVDRALCEGRQEAGNRARLRARAGRPISPGARASRWLLVGRACQARPARQQAGGRSLTVIGADGPARPGAAPCRSRS